MRGAKVHYNLAHVHAGKHEAAAALAHYRSAIDIHPGYYMSVCVCVCVYMCTDICTYSYAQTHTHICSRTTARPSTSTQGTVCMYVCVMYIRTYIYRYYQALANAGAMLSAEGHLGEALAMYERALASQPALSEV